MLDKVSFTLNKGKITTLVGPNGAGKSTLSKLVRGLLTPDSGEINRSRDLRGGYGPQRLYLDPTLPLTVRRFLQLGKNSRLSIEEALGRVGAQELLD
ncbi:ATP-binding cassette domain-containing protein, partial [Vibrio parahaemolyticus]|uniref:ATP-binding cassette domain-containing protein n=1 Tax=Vibrio parahaemolyticus TaxID=670 RepID=UPI001BB01441